MNRTPIHVKPLPEPKLEIINLIDVLITLVAFFMLTSTFIEKQLFHNLGIDLPQAQHDTTSNNVDTRVVIELTEDRQLFYHHQQISLKNLKELFQKQMADTVIVIQADKDCRYSWVVELLDMAAGCKLNKLALEVRKKSI